MIIGVFLSYIFVAPSDFIIPGFDLGSIGTALKLAINPIFFSAIQLYFVLKYIKYSQRQFYLNQIIVLLFLGVISLSLYILSSQFIQNRLFELIVFSFLYSVTMLFILYFKPQLAGLSRGQLTSFKYQFINITKNFFRTN